MKKFFIVLCVVAFAASSAYALDFQTSGSYYARGSWISNPDGLSTGDDRKIRIDPATGAPVVIPADPTVDYTFYDHEIDMTTNIVVDDNTFVRVRYEIQDSNWLRRGGNYDDLDDNIQFIRAWGQHTFTQTGTQLALGLMTGGAWAYDFANTGTGTYRVKVTQSTPIGPIIGILEKNEEVGQVDQLDDSEKDDNDAYYLAMTTKLGPVNVKPLFGYLYNSAADKSQNNDGIQTFIFDLGIDGSYDSWGFETEFQWRNVSIDDVLRASRGEDHDLWGWYGKLWANFGPAHIYGLLAYGNEDEGNPFYFGDDFEPQLLFGNQFAFGPLPDAISGSWYGVLGLDYTATEALSFFTNIGYVSSNMDEDVPFWDGATGWEFDLGLGYKISDAVKYGVGFGVGEIDLDSAGEALNGGDPDVSWRLYHRFDISF